MCEHHLVVGAVKTPSFLWRLNRVYSASMKVRLCISLLCLCLKVTEQYRGTRWIYLITYTSSNIYYANDHSIITRQRSYSSRIPRPSLRRVSHVAPASSKWSYLLSVNNHISVLSCCSQQWAWTSFHLHHSLLLLIGLPLSSSISLIGGSVCWHQLLDPPSGNRHGLE